MAIRQPLEPPIWRSAPGKRDLSAPGFAAGSVSGIAATGAGVLSAAITTPVLLHAMGAAQYGVWVMLASIAGYAQLADFGLGFSVGRFVGQYRVQRNVEALHRYFGSAAVIYVAVVIAVLTVSAALGIVVPTIAGVPAGERPLFFGSALLVGGATALAIGMALLTNVLHAYQRLPVANSVRAAYWVLLAPAFIAAALRGWGIVGLAGAMAATTAITFGLALVLTVWLVPDFRPGRPSAAFMRQTVSYAGWMFAISLSATMAFESSSIIIAGFIGIGAVAAYAVALRLTRTLTQFVHRISDVFFPFYSGMRAAGDLPGMRRNFLLTARLELAAGGVVILLLSFAGRALLGFWVGSETVLVLAAFSLAIILVALDLVAYPASVLVTAAGGERPAALMNIVQAAGGIAVAMVLVRPFGVAGVIGGAVVAQALTSVWWLPLQALRMTKVGWPAYLRGVVSPVLLSLVPALLIGGAINLGLRSPLIAAAAAIAAYGAVYLRVGVDSGLRSWLRRSLVMAARGVFPAVTYGPGSDR